MKNMKTLNKKFLLVILPLLYLTLIPAVAHAATITTCTLNQETYNQGSSGDIAVKVYNNLETIIRVTELTAEIDYYYEDGTVYLQTFYAPNDDLPVEIDPGQTETFTIPFSLPNDIAPGYIDVWVRAKTERWNPFSQAWFGSDNPTYQPTMYVESPYKQYYESQRETNDQLEQQLQEQQAINATTTNIMYLLVVTTLIFAAFAAFLTTLIRRPRTIAQPTP